MTTDDTAPIGHNGGPALAPYEAIRQEIEDLYSEAKNWADGGPIASQEQHDEIERLYDLLHDAGKRADEARKEEAKPYDEAKAEIQERYNTLIGNTKAGKGKVVMGKEALNALMLPWRRHIQEEKERIAAAAKLEADRLAEEARKAHEASAGNLEATEAAELLIKEAAAVGRFAKQATKGPTGLRSVWRAELVDEGAALDWAYGRSPEEFRALCQSQADAVVRAGMRMVPGFRVWEDKRAA